MTWLRCPDSRSADARVASKSAGVPTYAAKHHTKTTQLAELAGKAKPRLLIVYHASIVLRPGLRPQASSPEQVAKEVLSGYAGEVVVGRDLDVYRDAERFDQLSGCLETD
jgi:ribonuclease BN (tRNA processing enzyme)